MKKYYTILSLLFVLWKFEHDVVDVLEFSYDGTRWFELSGPYHLTENKQDYLIPVNESISDRLFFRVRRDWGEPLVPEDERPPRPQL